MNGALLKAVLACGLAILLSLPIGAAATPAQLSLLTSVSIFGLAATSLSIVWGQVGQISLAQVALFGIGAYTTMIVVKHTSISLPVVFAAAVLVTAGFGLIVGLPLLRLSGHHFAILTFAIAVVIETLEVRLYKLTGGFSGISLDPTVYLGAWWNEPQRFLVLCVTVTSIALAVIAWVTRSRWGDLMHATRENPQLAQAMGVDVRLHRVMAFALSGAVAGAAGFLYSLQTKVVAPDLFGTMVSIAFVAMVLVGSVRHVLGGVVGAAVYYAVPYYFGLDPLHNQILFGLLLLLLVIKLPDGILLGIPWLIRAVRRSERRTRCGGRSATKNESGSATEEVAA